MRDEARYETRSTGGNTDVGSTDIDNTPDADADTGTGTGTGTGTRTSTGRGTAVVRGARAGLRRRLVNRRIRIRRTRGRRLRRTLIVLLTVLANLVGAVLVAYHLTKIPEPHPETAMQSTVFVDDHGDYLGRRGPVDRQEIPLSQVPRHVQEAVIAAENRSFRTDTGISPKAIARAAWSTVSGGGRQGGSTITQQYVKNALLSPQQSLSRKAREALIAIKLDRTRSKDEILQGYLNTVYFGRGAAGIQSAARNYFGVDAKDLTVSQGAALASVINIPSYYEKAGSDPKVTATLVDRWEWVLDEMAHSGAITPAQRAAARFPAFRFYPPGDTDGQRQYLIDAAASEAADRLGITEDQLARGGYTVRTTFDLTAQDATAELAADGAEGRNANTNADKKTGDKRTEAKESEALQVHTAVVALVPGDGAVRVLYGGADYARQPFNDALDGAVEAGTALQPFSATKLLAPLADLPRTAAPTPSGWPPRTPRRRRTASTRIRTRSRRSPVRATRSSRPTPAPVRPCRAGARTRSPNSCTAGSTSRRPPTPAPPVCARCGRRTTTSTSPSPLLSLRNIPPRAKNRPFPGPSRTRPKPAPSTSPRASGPRSSVPPKATIRRRNQIRGSQPAKQSPYWLHDDEILRAPAPPAHQPLRSPCRPRGQGIQPR